MANTDEPRYTMRISRLTVDKLGVKLYDRVSAVIAELVANSYDADALTVSVEAPMNELLATKSANVVTDKGYTIQVSDDGVGMTPGEVNDFYLKVGAERRTDPRRGDRSKKYKRRVMGRKGVGKLAPFGVCQTIEIITSGGDLVEGRDEKGGKARGYLTAHLFLDRDKILRDTDEEYHPRVGSLDGTVRLQTGTTLILSRFEHRRVPSIREFERQLAQRFGVEAPNWRIILKDSQNTAAQLDHELVVGKFQVDRLPGSSIKFEKVGKDDSASSYRAVDPSDEVISDLPAGFMHEGRFYAVVGWVGYSRHPYRDDLMAGVRIYCRGKIAALTHIFNLKAGFTGEYDVRSYLVGELHANWLDEDEDLIRTDRQDILWSHELARAFEAWGQSVVKKIGVITRQPKRLKTWERFLELSDFESRLKEAYPLQRQLEIRNNAMEMARLIAQTAREDELVDSQYLKSMVELSLMFGPYVTLDRKLREAAEPSANPLSAVTEILRTAHLAELSAFGRIADDRVKVISKIESLKDDPAALEATLQSLITEAPWLINPQWSPITANQSFATLRQEFVKFFCERTGEDLELDSFEDGGKRADFVLSSQDNVIQIIEIKRPGHSLSNEEMERLNRYSDLMEEFLSLPGNEEFAAVFTGYHITLVCDRTSLRGLAKTAFEGLKYEGKLTHITWRTFLLRTRKMHEDFLDEAQRQRTVAARKL